MIKSLFDKDISRVEALSAFKENEQNTVLDVSIHRNHSIEMVTNIINPFLNYSQLTARFKYSSYDDSLTFSDANLQNSSLHIIWLDLKRYNKDNVFGFVEEKIKELRNSVSSPILVCYLDEAVRDLDLDIPDVYQLNIFEIVRPLGLKAFDEEKEVYSGTRLSAKANLLIAQYLGLKIIPSILKPSLKALVLDLDDTLYQGVLGEDGIQNLVPNNRLQAYLKSLKNQGFLLCIASKNESSDVYHLFENRNDFVLKLDDFTSIQANWNPKSENIQKIAGELNIGLDSILFIDNNIAEIEGITSVIPEVKTILASNENSVLQMLDLYPGLMKKSNSKEDLIRSDDIKANKERADLSKKLSKEDYFKKLEIKVEISINDPANIDRVVELLNKTNQFILSYRRYNKTEVLKLLESGKIAIATARMKDKLSDSGIIAIVIAKKDPDNNLFVDELTFSCRALGRNIEDIVISTALKECAELLSTSNRVKINYQKGPRNIPALTWLENYSSQVLSDFGVIEKDIIDTIKTYGLDIHTVRA